MPIQPGQNSNKKQLDTCPRGVDCSTRDRDQEAYRPPPPSAPIRHASKPDRSPRLLGPHRGRHGFLPRPLSAGKAWSRFASTRRRPAGSNVRSVRESPAGPRIILKGNHPCHPSACVRRCSPARCLRQSLQAQCRPPSLRSGRQRSKRSSSPAPTYDAAPLIRHRRSRSSIGRPWSRSAPSKSPTSSTG